MTKSILLRFSDLKSFDNAIKELKANRTVFSEDAQKRIQKMAALLETQVSKPMLTELRTYPPVRDRSKKVRWKSERQRRFVMMKASKGEIRLPYVRTGKLADSWRTKVTITYSRQQKKGILHFEVFNTSPIHQYVVGNYGQGVSDSSNRLYRKPQQPFHSDSGWVLAYKIIQRYLAKAKNIVGVELTTWSVSNL